jgi:hypothetical protein
MGISPDINEESLAAAPSFRGQRPDVILAELGERSRFLYYIKWVFGF